MRAVIRPVTRMDMLEQLPMQSLPVSLLLHGSLWDLVIHSRLGASLRYHIGLAFGCNIIKA